MNRLAESGAHRVALLYEFGNPIYNADANTPRFTVRVANAGVNAWGDNDLGHETVPIPVNALPNSGSDGKIVVIDWSTRKVYDMWQVKPEGGSWTVCKCTHTHTHAQIRAHKYAHTNTHTHQSEASVFPEPNWNRNAQTHTKSHQPT